MDPYEVLMLDPEASFDDAIVAHRQMTLVNRAASRFTGQNSELQQRRLDWALRMLEPLMSTLAFATPEVVIAALEQLLMAAVGPQSDLSESDWRGEGCS